MEYIPIIDLHVHFRDWNQSYKETIGHGLNVAQKAGVVVGINNVERVR